MYKAPSKNDFLKDVESTVIVRQTSLPTEPCRRSKTVVLVLSVLCVALWRLAAGLFTCFVLFIVLPLRLAGPVLHCDHLVGEKGCFGFGL